LLHSFLILLTENLLDILLGLLLNRLHLLLIALRDLEL
jgi:hypothetical protein